MNHAIDSLYIEPVSEPAKLRFSPLFCKEKAIQTSTRQKQDHLASGYGSKASIPASGIQPKRAAHIPLNTSRRRAGFGSIHPLVINATVNVHTHEEVSMRTKAASLFYSNQPKQFSSAQESDGTDLV